VVVLYRRAYGRWFGSSGSGKHIFLCLLDDLLRMLLLPLVVASLQVPDGPSDNHGRDDMNQMDWRIVHDSFVRCPLNGQV
jgi:hypothetical protein